MSTSKPSNSGTTSDDVLNDEERMELRRNIYMRECQLEGLFRDMFQSCNQHSFSSAIALRALQIDEVNMLFTELRRDVQTVLDMEEQGGVDSKNPKASRLN